MPPNFHTVRFTLLLETGRKNENPYYSDIVFYTCRLSSKSITFFIADVAEPQICLNGTCKIKNIPPAEVNGRILNPIQPLAEGMNPQWLQDTFGDKLAFFGGICVQDLLPNGNTAEIRNEVQRRIDILGANGGYIAAPAHNIQDDTSVENILAFFDACKNVK